MGYYDFDRAFYAALAALRNSILTKPVVLGGIATPSGGGGGPPGGFIGYLPQNKVAYDINEIGTFNGTNSLYDNLNHIRARLEVIEDEAGISYGGTFYPKHSFDALMHFPPGYPTDPLETYYQLDSKAEVTTAVIDLYNIPSGVVPTFALGLITQPSNGMGKTKLNAGDWTFDYYIGAIRYSSLGMEIPSGDPFTVTISTKVYKENYLTNPFGTQTELFNFTNGTFSGFQNPYLLHTVVTEPEFELDPSDRLVVKLFGISDADEDILATIYLGTTWEYSSKLSLPTDMGTGLGGGTITGSGILGPESSTNNALARWDGDSGKLLQNSLILVTDPGGINIPEGQTYNINGNPHTHAVPKLDDLSAPDNNTDLNVSITAHGLMPILPNDATKFINGVGNWVTVSGGGGTTMVYSGASNLGWFNIKDAGAIGDGSANDTTAVQTAINSAHAVKGIVYLPEGTYSCNTLTCYPDVSFIGAGAYSSIIKSRAAEVLLSYATPANPVTMYGVLQDFMLEGNNTGTIGIDLVGALYPTFRRFWVHGFETSGIKFRGVLIGQFYDSIIWDNVIGIDADKVTLSSYGNLQSNLMRFFNTKIDDNTTYGIKWKGGSVLTIDGGNFERNGTEGNASTGGIYYEPVIEGVGIKIVNSWFEYNNGLADVIIDSPLEDNQWNSIEQTQFVEDGDTTYGIYVKGNTKQNYLTAKNVQFYGTAVTSEFHADDALVTIYQSHCNGRNDGSGIFTQEGSSTGGYTEGAFVHMTASQSIATDGYAPLAWTAEDYDTDSMHDNSTNNTRITCKTAGKYAMEACIRFDTNSNGYRQTYFQVTRGATVYYPTSATQNAIGSGIDTDLILYTNFDLQVNDYVEVVAQQNTGSALNVIGGAITASPTHFSIQRIG